MYNMRIALPAEMSSSVQRRITPNGDVMNAPPPAPAAALPSSWLSKRTKVELGKLAAAAAAATVLAVLVCVLLRILGTMASAGSMEIYGDLWRSCRIYGDLWRSMEKLCCLSPYSHMHGLCIT